MHILRTFTNCTGSSIRIHRKLFVHRTVYERPTLLFSCRADAPPPVPYALPSPKFISDFFHEEHAIRRAISVGEVVACERREKRGYGNAQCDRSTRPIMGRFVEQLAACKTSSFTIALPPRSCTFANPASAPSQAKPSRKLFG